MKVVSLIEGTLLAWLSSTGVLLYMLGSQLGGLQGLVLSIIAVGNGQIAGLRLGFYLRERRLLGRDVVLQL